MKAHEIVSRRVHHAKLFLEEGQTIRSVSAKTGFSRGAVSVDLCRVGQQDQELYKQVRKKIEYNTQMRYKRGAEATKMAWKQKQQKLEEEIRNEGK